MRDPAVLTFALGVVLMAPILWAALGELVAEQSGVINVGIEGVLLISAIASAIVFFKDGNLVLSVFAGVGAGVVCGLVLAYAYVIRGMDQIVTGILFNILALGFTASLFTSQTYLASGLVKTFPDVAVPGLSDIPHLGEIFFDQDVLVYAALLTVPVIYLLMRRSWFGLHVRSAGEHPAATQSAGISVHRLRVSSVAIAGAFAGIGGATLVMSTSGSFVPGMTAGRGFIALGLVILARWNPFLLALACILFGASQALQFQAQSLAGFRTMPPEFWLMVPYLLTVVAVAVAARGSRYPAAVGIPFTGPGRPSIGIRLTERVLHPRGASAGARATG